MAETEMKLKQIKNYSAVYMDLDKILIDEKFNVRKLYDEAEHKSLTADIRIRGQMTPIMVQPRPSDSAHPYKLIMGFRRCRALKELGIDKVLAEIFDGDDFSAEAANLAENVQRADLLPYEVAQRLVQMSEKYRTTGEKLGRLVGLSGKYASNLMRLERQLCPRLLKLFHHEGSPTDKDPGVTRLLDFAALTHDEQEVEWEKYLGTASHKGKGVKEEKKDEKPAEEKDTKPRPSREEIDTALVNLLALVESKKYTTDQTALAVKALRWAGGVTETFPGVYSKAEEEKKEQAAKAAEKVKAEEAKEAEKLIREQEAAAKKATADAEKAIKAKAKAEADAAALKAKAAEADKKVKEMAAAAAKLAK